MFNLITIFRWFIVGSYRPKFYHKPHARKGEKGGQEPTSHKPAVNRERPTTRLTSLPIKTLVPTILEKIPKLCPYPGWLLYFPSVAYDVNHPSVKLTQAFTEFILSECLPSRMAPIDWTLVEESRVMFVDFASVNQSQTLARHINGWPLGSTEEHQPPGVRDWLQSLGLAVHTLALQELRRGYNSGKAFLQPVVKSEYTHIGHIATRLVGHSPTLPIRSLRAEHLEKLISIQGTVARLGPIKPLCSRLAFCCQACNSEQVLLLEQGGRFTFPTKCLEKGCRSRRFTPLFSSPSTVVFDTRTVLLQESDQVLSHSHEKKSDGTNQHQLEGSSLSAGRVPRSITCFLERDLVDTCMPGDLVNIIGMVALLPIESTMFGVSSCQPVTEPESSGAASGRSTNLFHLCLRVNNLTRINDRSGSNNATAIGERRAVMQCLSAAIDSHGDSPGICTFDPMNVSEIAELTKSDNYFSINDLYAIRSLSENNDLFRLLVASFCPNICGSELIKMAILLALFGGTIQSPISTESSASEAQMLRPPPSLSTSNSCTSNTEENGRGEISNVRSDGFEEPLTDRRCSSHILLVGDPGIGKSQLLRAAVNIAPRAVYVCGNTTSAAGLTVSTGRDQSGAGFGLEAGALVLADQGCCCIDEFDKMSCDPAALLEVLEQQTVSVARGGFVCNLAARTSVLAAANPVIGHYDVTRSIEENVRISRSLLSRFDLIFVLPDRPSQSLDRKLSEHVLALHTGQLAKKTSDNCFRKFSFASKGKPDPAKMGSDVNLEERLRRGNYTFVDLIPPYLVRKYIAYARKYVQPHMTNKAACVLRDYYVELRKERGNRGLFHVTIRQLESLIRLSSARARADLRENISEQDAKDACDLMNETGYGRNPSVVGVKADNSMIFSQTKRKRSISASGPAAAKRLLTVLQMEASRPGSNRMFTTQEIANLASRINTSSNESVLYQSSVPGSALSSLIDCLNNVGALLKRGPNLYSLS